MVIFFLILFLFDTTLLNATKSHQCIVLTLYFPPFYSETPGWKPKWADFQVTACESYTKYFITAEQVSFSTSNISFLAVHYPLNKCMYFKFCHTNTPHSGSSFFIGIINASCQIRQSEISVLIQPEVNLIYIICPERVAKQGMREVLFQIVTQGTRLM